MTLLHIPLSGEKSSLCPTLLACLLIKRKAKRPGKSGEIQGRSVT